MLTMPVNKYCYVKRGVGYGCGGKVLERGIITVQRFRYKRYVVNGEYGVSCYLRSSDTYQPLVHCSGKRFRTAREAQIYLNSYAKLNGLQPAETEW